MSYGNRFTAVLTALTILALAPVVYAGAPTLDPADDADHFGPPESLLFWSPEQKVAGFRNIDKIIWTRAIKAGDAPMPLPHAPTDLGNVQFVYGGKTMTVDDYVDNESVAGLLVIKDGLIVYERYGLGNTQDSLWVSFSVTKSVVSMLIGAAIKDGYIESVDEKVTDYLPRLKGSAYDQATIRDILQMASGVAWNEDYANPESDIARADMSTLGIYAHLRDKESVAQPGRRFNYNTAETNLVGTLLRSAIGNNLSTYLSEKIWQPFGMEADANWMLGEPGGGEVGGCCISATLRDYARIGLFALSNGQLADGTEVLPANWIAASTSPSEDYDGYGYLWWLDGAGVFRAEGIFGQGILIDPNNQIVIAQQSALDDASNEEDLTLQNVVNTAIIEALN